MFKMFYTLEEAMQKLGKTPEEIKELIAQGKLKEFNDAGNLMFKAQQVDELKLALSGLQRVLILDQKFFYTSVKASPLVVFPDGVKDVDWYTEPSRAVIEFVHTQLKKDTFELVVIGNNTGMGLHLLPHIPDVYKPKTIIVADPRRFKVKDSYESHGFTRFMDRFEGEQFIKQVLSSH